MTLQVDIGHRLGAFHVEAAFASSGRLTALFGPSGSGKSTLVNLIAGLIRPDRGRIEIDGKVLVDTARRVFIPGHRRGIGYVFQDARLFPHLSVAQNLRYGRWFTPAARRYADMTQVIDLLGLAPLLDRRPSLLSGGEKQRVAIGRALIASPRLILMDEPLASLDDQRKAEILPFIERLRDEMAIPIVYVSHSVPEVARLASDIVVMSEGKVAATGGASQILQRLDLLPLSERGEGGSILDMAVSGHDAAFAMTALSSPAGEIRVTGFEAKIGSAVRVRIRARDVMIATERPRGLSALNIIEGVIRAIEPGDGPHADISIDCHGQTITARITQRSRHDLGLETGSRVFAVIKAVSLDQAYLAGGGVSENL